MLARVKHFGPGYKLKPIETLEDLANTLDDPTPHEAWIEGLGSPNCYQDQLMWKAMARFIREKVIPLRDSK